FEGAEASFELLLRRAAPDYRPPFKVIDFLALVETRRGSAVFAEASVKLEINGEIQHTVADGNGPVNALDQALRKALLPYYPEVANLRLTDYKVRVIDGTSATAAAVRVLIESTDGVRRWSTVGASTNIIEASWFALVDSLEYGLLVAQRALAREPVGA
ncbi:MAG: citramalate synthase, partial [Chloroflexota bacterium]